MKLHRFYVSPETIELRQHLWVHDERLLNQWLRVLRLVPGDEVLIFDGQQHDRLYKIKSISKHEVELEHVTDFERKLPSRNIYLFFSLLKKDKNEWVIQKCTELGVHTFVPIMAERSEKLGFDKDRAEKIAIEAAEQCGRSDIPHIREVLSLNAAIEEYRNKVQLLVCDEQLAESANLNNEDSYGIFVGPEGGWSEEERITFKVNNFGFCSLGNLTLRAETAAVVAVSKLFNV